MIRRLTAVLAATGALLTAAPAALADIPPDPVAWITARGETIQWQSSSDLWGRNTTVVADGPLADRPGNRHTAAITANPTSANSGPRPGPIVLLVTLSLRDEDCPAGGGACTTLWAGGAALPYITTIPVPAADGSVRVQAPVPASLFRTTEPAGAPVPFGDTTLDVVLTPQNWRDPRTTGTQTSDDANRNASTDGYDTVTINSDVQGTGVTASGVVAGVPAQRTLDGGTWRDRGGAIGSAGPGLPPVRTRADAEPYLPKVRNGRVNHGAYGSAFWDGQLAGAAPLRTSTGYRLPGNTWRAGLYSQVLLEPGGRVQGTTTYGASLGIDGRQCARGQAWDDCTIETMPTIDVPATLWYRIDFGGAISYRFDAPVYEYLDDGTRKDHGTLAVDVTVRPRGEGSGTKAGWLVRLAQRAWQYTATLRYPATATMTVQGRPANGPGNEGNRWIEYATFGGGSL